MWPFNRKTPVGLAEDFKTAVKEAYDTPQCGDIEIKRKYDATCTPGFVADVYCGDRWRRVVYYSFLGYEGALSKRRYSLTATSLVDRYGCPSFDDTYSEKTSHLFKDIGKAEKKVCELYRVWKKGELVRLRSDRARILNKKKDTVIAARCKCD